MPSPYVARIPELTNNLLSLYADSTVQDKEFGLHWYPRAHRIVRQWSEAYGYSIGTVASVIAARFLKACGF